MAAQIAVDAKNFIGSGAKAWLIVGRLPGEDDDTAYLVLADDEGIAQETFKRQVFDDGDVSVEDQAHLAERYGAAVYVTTSQILN